jgi:CubicO group peptidase (beta-lactamase class C family)
MSPRLPFLAGLLLLPWRPAGAQPATAAAVDAVFANIAADGPGCAVGVGRNGALAHARGYGLADVEHRIPITPSTPFYIASTSKQFAAFSIALLARDGRLSLDDDVRRYLPELADFGSTITVRHLLHHTSGLRDYFDLLGSRGWPFDGLLTEEEFLRLVGRQRELNFPPGTQHLYSNTGYVLLSLIVQRVRGQSLRQFAQERIFAPLGMTRSTFRDDHRMLIPDRALAYEMIPGNALRLSVPHFDVVGDGGLYSTVEDLVRWAGNAHTPRSGDARDWATFTTRGILTSGDTIAYALGITHGRHGEHPTLAHGGAFGGYRAELLRVPHAQLDVAVLCNFAGADPSGYARRVVDALLPPPATPAAVGAAARRAIRPGEAVPVGTWMSRWTERWFRLVREGDTLVASGPFARTVATLDDDGVNIPAQRLSLRRNPAVPSGWEMLLAGAGREPLVALDTVLPRQGAIAATMGDFASPESDGRLTLIVESGQLTLRRVGVPPTRLAPLGPNRYTAGPVVVTMLGATPYDSLRMSTPRASRVTYVRVAR